MSGYHPDAVTIGANALTQDHEEILPNSPDAWEDDVRRILDAIEAAGFMIVDARSSETITLETPQGEKQC